MAKSKANIKHENELKEDEGMAAFIRKIAAFCCKLEQEAAQKKHNKTLKILKPSNVKIIEKIMIKAGFRHYLLIGYKKANT